MASGPTLSSGLDAHPAASKELFLHILELWSTSGMQNFVGKASKSETTGVGQSRQGGWFPSELHESYRWLTRRFIQLQDAASGCSAFRLSSSENYDFSCNRNL